MTDTSSALDPSVARTPTTVGSGMWSAVQPGRAAPSAELGKDAFLKLLVAQMKYQDPMNPSDSTEFVSQSAQFTMVEKIVAMEEQNEKLLLAQQGLTASTFIGRDVHWITKGPDGQDLDKAGTVTGVRFTKEGPMLRVGNEDIPLSVVQSLAPVISTEEPPDGTDGTAGAPNTTDSNGATDGTPDGTDADTTVPTD